MRVCGFTFRFRSVEQMRETLVWFETKVHPSTRLPDSKWLRAEHDVAQRWYERLPAAIKKSSRRERVMRALRRAIADFA